MHKYNIYYYIYNIIYKFTSLGGKEDLERFSKSLMFVERGKVYVQGIFDDTNTSDNNSVVIDESASK